MDMGKERLLRDRYKQEINSILCFKMCFKLTLKEEMGERKRERSVKHLVCVSAHFRIHTVNVPYTPPSSVLPQFSHY